MRHIPRPNLSRSLIHGFPRRCLLSYIHFSITTASTPPLLPTRLPAHHTTNLSICPLQVHKAPNSSALRTSGPTPNVPPLIHPLLHHRSIHPTLTPCTSPRPSYAESLYLPPPNTQSTQLLHALRTSGPKPKVPPLTYIHSSITTASTPPLLSTRISTIIHRISLSAPSK